MISKIGRIYGWLLILICQLRDLTHIAYLRSFNTQCIWDSDFQDKIFRRILWNGNSSCQTIRTCILVANEPLLRLSVLLGGQSFVIKHWQKKMNYEFVKVNGKRLEKYWFVNTVLVCPVTTGINFQNLITMAGMWYCVVYSRSITVCCCYNGVYLLKTSRSFFGL